MRNSTLHKCLSLAGLLILAGLLPGAAAAQSQQVNLYTTREPGLIQPLLDAFTAASGVKVNTVFMSSGLAERVEAEGELSPADVLMTVDIGNLIDLFDRGLTQGVDSVALNEAIPANLRGETGHWYALSLRARVLYADSSLGVSSVTYEQLDDEQWRNRLCSRSGQHPYNIALFAAYIAHHGEAATETWLRGIKSNLARAATGGDRDGARDILGGICDIAIANSYYVGLMRSGAGGPQQLEWGNAITVLLPTFANGGTHVNVSGAAVAKHAPNREAAVRLLEFLVSELAQKLYAEANFEYPVRPGVAAHPIIAELGTLNIDSISLLDIARQRARASVLVDQVGFDQ